MEDKQTDTTVHRVMEMLRRDLKLGDDIFLDEQTPLFGDALDLDSLDVVLLVTSVEKEFGVRIADRATGMRVFQTVRSIADFVERASEAAPAGGVLISDPERLTAILDRLPHGPAFRCITRLRWIEPRARGEGVWSLRGDEACLAGHFPGRPVVPGVMIAEALAQLSALVAFAQEADVQADSSHNSDPGSAPEARLAQVNLRFREPAEPPADIVLSSELSGDLSDLGRFEVCASVADKTVASGTLVLGMR